MGGEVAKASVMAGANGNTAGGATANTPPGLEGDDPIRIQYDPVMIALSKATAARDLLARNHEGIFDDENTVDWVESFADAALGEALDEAKAAYLKAVGDKPTTSEATR